MSHTNLPSLSRVSDIRVNSDPALEAWLYHFLTENNIEYLLNPSIVASPEQLRFMVAFKEDQVYLPCDDELFFLIYRQQGAELSEEYLKVWRFVTSFVQSYNMSKEDSERILALCRYRFNLYFSERVILPSRMAKRLLTIVLTQCGRSDPFREKKRLINERAAALLENPAFQAVLHQCPLLDTSCLSIPNMRHELNIAEMTRLLSLSTLVKRREGEISLEEAHKDIEKNAGKSAALRAVFGPENTPRKKVLYIPDVAGDFVFDLVFIRALLRQGHKVVLALKESFYFDSPTVWDMENEPLLKKVLVEDAYLNHNDSLTKNGLLHLLREHHFMIISDGLAEQLNLCRASVTFARAWKECDLVIAKGRRNKAILLGSSHEFTRDILCCWRTPEDNTFHMELKPKADWVRQFPEQEILTQARGIVAQMRAARDDGKTVMFYSAIIGSIPGQTKVAIQLVTAFVTHLRDRLENTFIINPAEHFEEGMDGDDLMYMWEHVQRSGLLDVWRFQTVEDIEKSFALLDSKVPSAWSGKDSTFSTGCTKEMRIAIDVQKLHPELQIIGPSAEKFFRRRDYGVGKYFDATLKA
jgi:uncharacterized protein with ATP-grasp and redox domains